MIELFCKFVPWISEKFKQAGAFSLVGMMLLTCADVICRFCNKPIPGAIEIAGFLAILTTALALPYTHQMDAHIGVGLFVERLPRKIQGLIRLSMTVFSVILFGIVSWRMAVYADTIHQSGEVSMDLKLPEYLVIYLVAACFLVFFLTLVLDIITNFKKMLKG
jgi:TRAP-type transport system small permease protein